MSDSVEVQSQPQSQRAIGCVKWFNKPKGTGFITVNDCETNEKRDIFVHHSAIKVANDQYRYLIQGEYVSFDILPSAKEGFLIEAANVRGVNDGALMCETRNTSFTSSTSTTTASRPSSRKHSKTEYDKANKGR